MERNATIERCGVPSLVDLCCEVLASTEQYIQFRLDALTNMPAELSHRLLNHIVRSVQFKLCEQTLQLKIQLCQQQRLVTHKFSLHESVRTVLETIFDKSRNNGRERFEDYGLFQRSSHTHPARYLDLSKTLSYYDLKPGDILDFKLKATLLKVEFWGPWPSTKTFLVDESETVRQITRSIVSKLGYATPDEFSLQTTEDGPSSSLGGSWLDPDLSLLEQGLDVNGQTFLLRKKFFFQDYSLVQVADDEESLNRIFCQNLDAVVAGTWPCTLEEAMHFSSILFQVRLGDAHFETASLADQNWSEYLPPEFVPLSKKIEKDILIQYKLLTGLTTKRAKLRYLQFTKELKSYGYTFFRAEKLLKERQIQPVLFGVSKDCIIVLTVDTKEVLFSCALTEVAMWRVRNNTLCLFFLNHEDQYITPEVRAISLVLSEYIQFNLQVKQRKRKSPPTDLTPQKKERLRQLRIALSTNHFFDSTESIPNSKKNPVYINPNHIHVNPLFSGGEPLYPPQFCNDKMYYSKMIRTLVCLRSSLKPKTNKREIRVRFPDKSIKSFVVNETQTVSDIARGIGQTVGIKDAEEFSLQREDEAEVWLNPYQALGSQKVAESTILVFKKKFYYNDAFVTNTDPVYFNLLYCQSRDAITSGKYPCSLNEAIQLAATQFQISFGDHNPSIHQPGFLQQKDLKFFLPFDCLEVWGLPFQKLEKMIYKEHQKLRGIKEEYAKYRYLLLCRSLRTYGTVFFQVELFQHNGRVSLGTTFVVRDFLGMTPESLLLGFSRDCILLLYQKTKKIVAEYPLTHLRCWSYTPDTCTLDFGDYDEGIFHFSTIEGEAISHYLSDYLDFRQKNIMGTQTFNTDICKYPPVPDNFFLSQMNTMCCWENGKRVFTSSFLLCEI